MTSMIPDVNTPAGILQLSAAFCGAKTLLTAVDLDLFSTLHSSPATEEEIRQRLALHGRGLSEFLHLLVAFGLLEKDGDRYRPATARCSTSAAAAGTSWASSSRPIPSLRATCSTCRS